MARAAAAGERGGRYLGLLHIGQLRPLGLVQKTVLYMHQAHGSGTVHTGQERVRNGQERVRPPMPETTEPN